MHIDQSDTQNMRVSWLGCGVCARCDVLLIDVVVGSTCQRQIPSVCVLHTLLSTFQLANLLHHALSISI